MTADPVSRNVWRMDLPSQTMPPWQSTNTYLIVDNGVAAIVDPGFDDSSSDEGGALAQIRETLTYLGARTVKAVLLTHTHSDHRAGLATLHAAFDKPAVYVHPDEIERLTEPADLRTLRAVGMSDGRVLTVGNSVVEALHTPGHSPGHLAFHLAEEGVLLAGDLVAGSGSVWVGLPEGDVNDYLDSLRRMERLPNLRKLGPGHGPLVHEPYLRLREAQNHRLERELQVIEALETSRTLVGLRDVVYPDLPEPLRRAAEASLLAHLRKLMNEMRVVHLGQDSDGPFIVRR